jgi:hypothetical protein
MRGELVVMSRGGDLCILIPLYTKVKGDLLDQVNEYQIYVSATEETPTGYLCDWEETGEQSQFFNEKILGMVEVLGDL